MIYDDLAALALGEFADIVRRAEMIGRRAATSSTAATMRPTFLTCRPSPQHFHNGTEDNVEVSQLPVDPNEALRVVLRFVRQKLAEYEHDTPSAHA